jgi:phenylalanyl-tRNA synthetase beta chain
MRLAGLALPREEIIRILTKLGFAVSGGDMLSVAPPSWRPDIHGAADLVEEVVRIYGLNRVPAVPMARTYAVAQPVLTTAQRRVTAARRALAARGFDETVHFSFISHSQANLFSVASPDLELANPISADLTSMRKSLLPGLLAAAARNQARGLHHAMLFEIGPQFFSARPGDQKTVAAGVRVGDPPRHWRKGATMPDIFAAKADALAALEAAWGQDAGGVPVEHGGPLGYHPGRSGKIVMGKMELACFGELHPSVIAALDLKGPVSAFEIYLDAIPTAKARASKARGKLDLSPLMPVERDFAFILNSAVPAAQAVKAARAADPALIDRVDVFDLYEGKGMPEGKKSLAIAVRLQPKERTLTEAEIDAVGQKIVNAVTKATGGVLRS